MEGAVSFPGVRPLHRWCPAPQTTRPLVAALYAEPLPGHENIMTYFLSVASIDTKQSEPQFVRPPSSRTHPILLRIPPSQTFLRLYLCLIIS